MSKSVFMKNRITRVQVGCLRSAIVWLAVNGAYGIAPLIFLSLINPILKGKSMLHEIKALINGGITFFACCALMGAVFVDIIIEKVHPPRLVFMVITVVPLAMFSLICLLYILILFGHISTAIFSISSKFHLCVISFTVFYCILAKYYCLTEKKKAV